MNRLRVLAFLTAALVVLACGGGGGGGGGTTPTVSLTLNPPTASVAPGGTVNFTATISGTSNHVANFSTSAGTITKTGDATATLTAPASGTVTVTARADADASAVDTSTVTVTSGAKATVRGRVIDNVSLNGVPDVVIEFRSSAGVVLATVTTGADGRFVAKTAPSATVFHVVTVPVGFFNQYEYNSTRYSTLIDTCTAPLPALTSTSDLSLPGGAIKLTPTSQPPPPPPNGCS